MDKNSSPPSSSNSNQLKRRSTDNFYAVSDVSVDTSPLVRLAQQSEGSTAKLALISSWLLAVRFGQELEVVEQGRHRFRLLSSADSIESDIENVRMTKIHRRLGDGHMVGDLDLGGLEELEPGFLSLQEPLIGGVLGGETLDMHDGIWKGNVLCFGGFFFWCLRRRLES
ncbi:hypothetical protein MCOR29_010035 [Pyricularia oryzae]|nr:hypothetical protein MCOR29_010035 [Pyricularia oryzae]KAI6512937.1 hypothetical protein MCOR10_009496 [Pyricularia oryzae]